MLCVAIAALEAPVALGQARTRTHLTLGAAYDTNADGVRDGAEAVVTQFAAHLTRPIGGDGAGYHLFFDGVGYVFGGLGDRTFASNRLGLYFAKRVGDDPRDRITGGASFGLRSNRSIYEIYDYVGLSGYIQGKWYGGRGFLHRAGYTFDARTYANLPIREYADHSFFYQLNRFLPTRTTLRVDFGLGIRSRQGYDGQAVAGFQVAQSIAAHTGLSIRYQRRINLRTAQNDPLRFGASLYGDDDLLRDRYDYSGDGVSARLTQQLPRQARLIVAGGFESQSYEDELALDLEGNAPHDGALRSDRYSYLSVSLELPVTERWTTYLGCGMSRNASNDVFYDYGLRRYVSLDLGVSF